MTALVTDGDSRQALAVVRSLGRRRIPTVVGGAFRGNLASASRYCRGRIFLPSCTADPRGFQQALLEAARSGRFRILMPISDPSISLAYPLRNELERHLHVALPHQEAYERATDKKRLLSLASELGIPAPGTTVPSDLAEAQEAAEALGWPVVVKPRRSKMELDGRWFSLLVAYARNRAELKRKWSRINTIAPPPLIQERITGPGMGIFVLALRGRILALFSHRRLREKPPSGGVSVLRESVRPEPALVLATQNLVESLSWTGVMMLEFKRDLRDGVAKLIEANARFWGSLQLAIDAGFDFPYQLYSTTLGRDVLSQSEIRLGVRSRWLLGDLDHLLSIVLLPRHRLSLPAGYPEKLRSLFGFIVACGPGTRTEVLRPDDPLPFLKELGNYMLDIPRRLRHVFGRRLAYPPTVLGG